MRWVLLAVGIIAGVILLIIVIGLLLPKRHTVSRSSSFRASPQTVWNTITGPPDWRPDVRSYEPLPDNNGHRVWNETDRHGQKIKFEEVEALPPGRLVIRIADPKLPFGGSWTYMITPGQEGSTLTITEEGEVYNPIFRFVSRFVMGHASTIENYLKALHQKLDQVR